MTERRETGHGRKKTRPTSNRRSRPSPKAPHKGRSGSHGNKRKQDTTPDWSEGERIAKYLARCGVASRRACETLITEGKVSVDGVRIKTPAFKVTGRELIKVDRKIVKRPEPTRLWRYHKPAGLLTTNHDPAGRSTIFEQLPKSLPRTITIGRLDYNTEGLLLLTNNGELARTLELPGNAFQRIYRARAHGRVTQEQLDTLQDGVSVDGEKFGAIHAELERQTGANCWINVTLAEGKNREVRRALETLELKVNRLIRVSYGPFELKDLRPGAVVEIPPEIVASEFGALLSPSTPKAAEKKPARSKASPKRRFDGNKPSGKLGGHKPERQKDKRK